MISYVDEEKMSAPPALDEKLQAKKETSSLRKWGPAMVDIAPSGSRIPELNENSMRKLELIEARTDAVLERVSSFCLSFRISWMYQKTISMVEQFVDLA